MAAEAGTDERVAKKSRAVDRHKVDLGVVGDLVPVHKPEASCMEGFKPTHATEDVTTLGPHARLECRVIIVAEAGLTLGEEAAILRAEIDATRGRAPLGRARVIDANTASRDHHVELILGHVVPAIQGKTATSAWVRREDHHIEWILGHVVPDIRGHHKEGLALRRKRQRAGVRRAVVPRPGEAHIEACATRAARIGSRCGGECIGHRWVVCVSRRRVVDARVSVTARLARGDRLVCSGVH